MYAEITSSPRPPHALGFWPAQGTPRPLGGRAWRQPPVEVDDASARILASRWVDERATARVEHSIVPAGRYVIGVALRPVRIRLGHGAEAAYDGMMPTGMVHVSEPGQAVEAEFSGPCDFIHFHVAAEALRDRQAAAGPEADGEAAGRRPLRDLLVRDELAAQLSRSLTESQDGSDPLYAQSIGQTILMRLLALRQPAPRVGAWPKWRLRRVQEHLSANISEPMTA